MRRLATRLVLAGAVGGALLLAGCGTPSHREWTASGDDTAMAAFDECGDEVDTIMRLRGYPHRPLPETPQFKYRREIFGTCMRRKGYEPD